MVLSFIPLKDDQKLPDLLSITANLTTLLHPTCGTKDKTLYVRISNMKKSFILISIIFFLLGGASALLIRAYMIPNLFDTSRKQYNANYPSLIIEPEVSKRLTKIGVSHKLENGTIYYSSVNKLIVEMAFQCVDKKYIPDWENFYFNIDGFREYYINLLKENKIPFITRKLDAEGNEYILTDPFYDQQVRDLQDKVHLKFFGKVPPRS